MLNDEKWPQSIKELEILIDKYQNKLVDHAFYKLGNRFEAEDTIQEVFIKVYNERDNFKHVRNIGAFLFRMTSNACIDRIRKRKPNNISLKLVKDQHIVENEGKIALQLQQEFERIDRLLQLVPAGQAEVLRLRIIDGLQFDEIAQIIKTSVPTVKSRFRYGIDKIKNYLVQKRR